MFKQIILYIFINLTGINTIVFFSYKIFHLIVIYALNIHYVMSDLNLPKHIIENASYALP